MERLPLHMEILVPHKDVVVLALEGDADLNSSADLRDLLLPLVRQDSQQVVVDVTMVRSIDSTTLGLLAACARQAKTRLSLVCSDEGRLETLRLVGVDRICTVFGSRATAVAATASRAHLPPA